MKFGADYSDWELLFLIILTSCECTRHTKLSVVDGEVAGTMGALTSWLGSGYM